jgi:hypothetical protein
MSIPKKLVQIAIQAPTNGEPFSVLYGLTEDGQLFWTNLKPDEYRPWYRQNTPEEDALDKAFVDDYEESQNE